MENAMQHDAESPNEPDEIVHVESRSSGDEDGTRRAVPAWILSLVVHALVLGLLSLIIYAAREDVDEPPLRTAHLPKPIEDEKPQERREDPPETVPLPIPEATEKPSPVTELEVPIEEFASEDEEESDMARGREEATSTSEIGQQGAFMAIGSGGGVVGMYGSRQGTGKKRAIGRFGGTPGSEKAVDGALRWFKKHQSMNGQWDVDGYPANCGEAPRCEPGTAHTDEAGDLAGTGYALLCFLGAGYDQRMASRYRATVRKGLDWLVSMQQADGSFGKRNYEHAIATMALVEAYGMSKEQALKEPAQKAIDVLLSRQTKDGKGGYGLGWDYVGPNPTRIDASVSGWCVMALKSAAASGLNVGNGLEDAKQYLERAWKATNRNFVPKDPYTDTSTFPYTWNSETDAVEVKPGSDSHDMAPVGALMAVFLHHDSKDPMLNSMANHIMTHMFPKAYPLNTYYMYYNTLAMFMVNDERWLKWNASGRDMLLNAQRQEQGCFDGSWDWESTKFHGHQMGRILSTAYCCLSLEVYYRYLPPEEVAKMKRTGL